jgi:hypothetical protein
MCADLFSNEAVKLTGNLQVRSLHLCEHQGSRCAPGTMQALRKLLNQARTLIQHRSQVKAPYELYIELFFAGCIFEPGSQSVHGDFSLAHVRSNGQWPLHAVPSGKGPYGRTGIYEKKQEGTFQCIDEDEFFSGNQWQTEVYSLSLSFE